MVNIIIDDDLFYRKTPEGYIRFTDSNELMKWFDINRDVSIGTITFDNDLGLNIPEGYYTLKYMIELRISPSIINIHSANIIAVKGMLSYAQQAVKFGIIDSKVTNVPLQKL